MWLETSVSEGIDWHGVTVDGFRPKGKALMQMAQKAGIERMFYRGPRADRVYCDYGAEIKRMFHTEAKNKGLAKDDRCLTYFLVPGSEFGLDYEDLHSELKMNNENTSAYRILIFQLPKNACEVYKNCIENLLKNIGFENKESYKDPTGCEIDLKYITRVEIKASTIHVLNLHIKDPPWEKQCDRMYQNTWPIYRDFSYPPFEKWYLGLIKTRNSTHI
jgi:hypothetical protein